MKKKKIDSHFQNDKEHLEIFEVKTIRQTTDFTKCFKNTFHVTFFYKMVKLKKDSQFTQFHDYSDHEALHFTLHCHLTKAKEPIVNFRSLGSADYKFIKAMLCLQTFQSVFCLMKNNMYVELCGYINQIIKTNVPIRARFCQSFLDNYFYIKSHE